MATLLKPFPPGPPWKVYALLVVGTSMSCASVPGVAGFVSGMAATAPNPIHMALAGKCVERLSDAERALDVRDFAAADEALEAAGRLCGQDGQELGEVRGRSEAMKRACMANREAFRALVEQRQFSRAWDSMQDLREACPDAAWSAAERFLRAHEAGMTPGSGPAQAQPSSSP